MWQLAMLTQRHPSHGYDRAFAVRARMVAFQAQMADVPTWKLASKLFARRFDLTFGFFLDAPTPDRLARIEAFENEMEQIAGHPNYAPRR
jgi:hypothetical protein